VTIFEVREFLTGTIQEVFLKIVNDNETIVSLVFGGCRNCNQLDSVPEIVPLSVIHINYKFFVRLATLFKYSKKLSNGIYEWQLTVTISDQICTRYQCMASRQSAMPLNLGMCTPLCTALE
jgi:hypothetical protein